MSWTQGVIPREDMSKTDIAALERNYLQVTGDASKVEYVTWHEIDRSDLVAHFESGRGFRVGRKARP